MQQADGRPVPAGRSAAGRRGHQPVRPGDGRPADQPGRHDRLRAARHRRTAASRRTIAGHKIGDLGDKVDVPGPADRVRRRDVRRVRAARQSRCSASSPRSSSCSSPSARCWPWACRSAPRCSASASASALVGLLSQRLRRCPTSPPQMAAMIGLGVGIDYALFIVTRYREAPPRRRWSRRTPIVDGARHRRPGRALRRHHRDDLAARPVPHGPGVRPRPGRRRRRRRAGDDDRVDHAAAGAARLRRRAHRGHARWRGDRRRRCSSCSAWSACSPCSRRLGVGPARLRRRRSS